ncbi:MAG: hypothetical protein ACK4NC_00470 [Candidatus Gracilibacteria bacterium]
MTSLNEESKNNDILSENSIDTAEEVKKLLAAPEPKFKEVIQHIRVALNPATLIFNKNPYGITPENFWEFEIFFTAEEISRLLGQNKVVNAEFIDKLGKTLIVPFYYSKIDHALLSDKERSTVPDDVEEMTFLEALKIYGIDTLKKTKEEGIHYL